MATKWSTGMKVWYLDWEDYWIMMNMSNRSATHFKEVLNIQSLWDITLQRKPQLYLTCLLSQIASDIEIYNNCLERNVNTKCRDN